MCAHPVVRARLKWRCPIPYPFPFGRRVPVFLGRASALLPYVGQPGHLQKGPPLGPPPGPLRGTLPCDPGPPIGFPVWAPRHPIRTRTLHIIS